MTRNHLHYYYSLSTFIKIDLTKLNDIKNIQLNLIEPN